MNHHHRPLIALLSSLISQILLCALLLFPANPFYAASPFSGDILFPLLNHFLSTAAAVVPFFPRKRKRTDDIDNHAAADEPARPESVVSMAPDSIKLFFRMKASSFEWLCGLLEPLLECRDPVGPPIGLPAEIRLGIGLFRLAAGADYPEISDRFRVSEPVARFCVKHLCRVLCTNYRFWVGFPSQAELDSVVSRIETLVGIPNCCGTLGCARFNFDKNFDSIRDNSDRNYAVAAQIVVDSNSRILNIAAGFHGRKRDSEILKSSSLFSDISKSVLLNSRQTNVSIPRYLLGYGEYPLLPWLIVPFDNPERGSMEANFNNKHRLLRTPWNKAVASLRSWGIMNGCVTVEYRNAVACIGACSILHNMLIMREDYSAFSDGFDEEEEGEDIVSGDWNFGGDSGEAAEVRRVVAMMVKR